MPLFAEHSDGISLSGVALQGANRRLPAGRGLIHFNDARGLRITDCAVSRAGSNAIVLQRCEGTITGTIISDAADNALFCTDSRGLILSANTIRGAGNGGIRVWQSETRDDGSLIVDIRIEDTHARAGGDGQNGNAINVYRAGNVIVRGNQIRKAAFSAVRGNAASNIQIVANNCGACDDVALYSEFGFQGAVIADNVIDEAGSGISVTNFDVGGRLASVHGNVLRNLRQRIPNMPPQGQGVGIAIEADTAVTGNVIEDAPRIGIHAGWGPYLRNVSIAGNVVRNAGAGIEVSVAKGAGAAAITGNLIAGAKRGAIVGMEWDKQASGDLAREGAAGYPQLTIANNRTG